VIWKQVDEGGQWYDDQQLDQLEVSDGELQHEVSLQIQLIILYDLSRKIYLLRKLWYEDIQLERILIMQ
jgi:hypothetical protein